ncbi:MAG: DUF1844 domain-containing protein [Acidobacteriota bacterium]|nr:DUF1844 domain-containing protein [Acidobacteriota bacterium]MDQ5872051.1 DUF1844 domain-containing protein [Acidobacteriota bacterium]
MAEREEKPIRVVDRRMFTPEGELRPGFEPEEASAPPPPPATPRAASLPPSPEAPDSTGMEADATPLPPADEPSAASAAPSEFARIVSSLATTAYSALGLLADPATGGSHPDLAIARQMIDWLGVLEQKTRGNLSFEESDLLSRALYELRLAYVEVGRAPTK